MLCIPRGVGVVFFFLSIVIYPHRTPSANLEPRRHETQSTHTAPHKAEGGVEYAATALGASERYSASPQP